jgi:hypothetical protein
VSVYHIVVWKGFLVEPATKKGEEWRSDAQHVEYSLMDLEPYTKYHIKVES